MSRISVIVKQSCTSAQSISARVRRRPSRTRAAPRCAVALSPVKLSFSCRYGWSVATPKPATYTGWSVNSCGPLGGDEQHRRRAVGLRAAVEQVQRVADRRRLQHVVDRDLVLEVRVRIAGAVVVVLHRDRREHLARRAELVHVPGRERREQHRRGLAAREDRVPGRGARQQAFLGRLVAHLLDADDEHDVVHAARHRHRADAERVGARRARVLDARARDAGEADRGRHGVAADALLAPERARAGWRRTRPRPASRLEALVDARRPRRRTRPPPSARSSGRTARPS